MVLGLLTAIAACPAIIGTTEAVRSGQNKNAKEKHRGQKTNLVASCVKSSSQSAQINGGMVVLKNHKVRFPWPHSSDLEWKRSCGLMACLLALHPDSSGSRPPPRRRARIRRACRPPFHRLLPPTPPTQLGLARRRARLDHRARPTPTQLDLRGQRYQRGEVREQDRSRRPYCRTLELHQDRSEDDV